MGRLGGSGSPKAGADTELTLLYRGQPAAVSRLDADILIMRWMGWDYVQLCDCPIPMIERIRRHMRAEARAAESERDRINASIR